MKWIVILFPLSLWAAKIEISSENLKSFLSQGNSQISASRLEKEASEEKEGFLARSFLPSFEIYGAHESFKVGRGENKNQPVYGGELKVNIFNAGRDKLENEIRKLDSDIKKVQMTRVFSEQLEKARILFWELLYLREKSELIQETLELNKKNLNSANNRIKNGVATASDRFEFEMQEVDLKREAQEILLEERIKIQNFKLLLGLPEKADIFLKEKFNHDHEFEAELSHQAKDHEFLYKENEIQSEQKNLSALKNQRSWWPRVETYAAYNQFNEREEDFPSARDRQESVVGIKMILSLSSGFEDQKQAAAFRKEALASERLAELQKKEVEIHIQAEMEELKLLHDQIHDAEENIERAEKYYRLTQSEYGRGVKNSPDILGASEKLFERKHKRLEIIRNFHVAKAHVLSKLGK